MNWKQLGLAAIAELLLLAVLAGTTLIRVVDTIQIPTVQLVSIAQPGNKLNVATVQHVKSAKTTAATKSSDQTGSQHSSSHAGPEGNSNSAQPASYPGDRDTPSLQSALSVTYPKTAQNEEWEGEVVIQVSVNASGHPTNTKIVQSSGHPVLDEAFAQAIMKMSFKPRRHKGVDEQGDIELRHRFKL